MTRSVAGGRWLWVAAAGAAVLGIALLVGPRIFAGAAPSRSANSAASSSPAVSTPLPVNRPSAGPSPSAPLVPSDAPATGLPKPPAPSWQPVAVGFARDFTSPGTGHADWLARVSRWTSDYLAGQYQQTDPHRIPTGALTSLMTVTPGESSVDFLASYDTGLKLACRVELGPTGWKVTRAQPAADGQTR